MLVKKILITGAAGFIGFHTVKKFIDHGYAVVGLDNLSAYYSVQLKQDRLKECGISGELKYGVMIQSTLFPLYRFIKLSVDDKEAINTLFSAEQFDGVIHLAAQPGIQYSLTHPFSYAESNLMGFLTILEACRNEKIAHLVYASSSSVYGNNPKPSFSEADFVDNPISLYAATKKSNELMAHVYSHLYQIPTTGLRFFTVIGPWGRPDMALFKFTQSIVSGKPISIFNFGNMERDFTYIDDIVEGVFRVFETKNKTSEIYHLFNIGNNHPIKLLDFVSYIEDALGIKASKQLLPLQPGDVNSTCADTSKLESFCGYKPSTPVKDAVDFFVKWYKNYFNTTPNKENF